MTPLTRSRAGHLGLLSAFRVRGSSLTIRQPGAIASYAIALGLGSAALVVKAVGPSGLGDDSPVVLLMAAVLLGAVVGGFGPGITGALAALVGGLAFFPPGGNLELDFSTLTFTAAFAVEAGLMIAAGTVVHSSISRRRTTDAAMERAKERLRVARAAAGVGTCEWDIPTGRMVWSDGLEPLLGLAPGALPSSPAALLDLLHPDDREPVKAAIQGALTSGQFEFRCRASTTAGEFRWLSCRGQVFHDPTGAPDRIVGVASDLTEQVRIEEAMRLNGERFRMMANAAPVLLRVKSPEGKCVFVNERWAQLTGRPEAEHLGFGWLDSLHPDDREACRQQLLSLVRDRRAGEFEYRVITASGEHRWMLDRNAPVTDGTGELLGFVGSCTDITERRRAEEALRFAAEAGSEFGGPLKYEDALRKFSGFAVPRFADWCVVHMRGEDGQLRRLSVVHHDPSLAAATDRISRQDELDPDGTSIAARVIRSGEPILITAIGPEHLAEVTSIDHRAALEQLGARSAVAVPMPIQRAPIGAIVFLRGPSRRSFTDSDLTLAQDLGRRAAVAIENARLYSNLLDRETALERANETLTFLLDASAELSRTLDPKEMLTRLATLATPRVADWCTILSLDENRQPQTLAVSHRDPDWQDRVRELQDRYPFAPRPDAPVMRALVHGEASFIPRIGEELLAAAAVNDEHLAMIRQLGLASAIIAPLTGQQRTYGAMTFVMSDSGRHYGEEDFATLKDLAHRAAIALDNATLYQDAQEREQELLRANEAKDEFLSMMSHELRTPLTIINGGARVLRARSAELDRESRESILMDIESESDRLFRMVENLLSLAHLEFGEAFEVEPVHAGRLAEKVIAAFHTRRPDRPVVLRVEPGAETFAAQPVYLEQVIRNLLSNADKYSKKGAPIEIDVRRTSEGAGEFRVLDRGVGIEPEEAELIFERFYRSERTSRLVGGTGVGLALCKRLIEAMAGTIWARPREGGGLELGFSLPLYEEAFV